MIVMTKNTVTAFKFKENKVMFILMMFDKRIRDIFSIRFMLQVPTTGHVLLATISIPYHSMRHFSPPPLPTPRVNTAMFLMKSEGIFAFDSLF